MNACMQELRRNHQGEASTQLLGRTACCGLLLWCMLPCTHPPICMCIGGGLPLHVQPRWIRTIAHIVAFRQGLPHAWPAALQHTPPYLASSSFSSSIASSSSLLLLAWCCARRCTRWRAALSACSRYARWGHACQPLRLQGAQHSLPATHHAPVCFFDFTHRSCSI